MEKEKCLLIGVDRNKRNDIDASMNELKELVDAVDGDVVSSIVQKRENIDKKYYIGKGKIEEISMFVEELDVDTVIINDELSGSQLKNIEDALQVKVIDKTMLILDIFAKRASTSEGKLQVELAQLKYRLPRLIGIGKSLSRQGAGIGTRGPGEKKIETDRRHILGRIHDIEKLLAKAEKARDAKRKKRLKGSIPIVSIVGYTNVGKSTLLNTLIDTENKEEKIVFAHDMLFATLETELRKIKLTGGKYALFSDTVGFVRDLPTQLIEAFKGTLEEIKFANVILHVIDVNNKDYIESKKVTMDIVNSILTEDIPIIEVYNKLDLIEDEYINNSNYSYNTDNKIYISAKKNINIDKLLNKIDKVLNGEKVLCKMEIPREDIDIYFQLFNERKVSNIHHKEYFINISAVLYKQEINIYEKYIKEIEVIG